MKEDGVLMYKGKLYVPNSKEMKNIVMREMHNVPYDGIPWYRNSNEVVRRQYIFPEINKYVSYCIAKWLECQKIKGSHRNLVGLL